MQADITGPLGEQFAGRIVGMTRDGELISKGQANDKDVLLPSITWRPSDRTERHADRAVPEGRPRHAHVPAHGKDTASPAAGDPPVKHDLFIGEPGFNHMEAEQYGATLLFAHRFNDMVAFSSSNRYLDSDVDYAEVWGCCGYADPERTLLSREFYVLDGDYKVTNSDTNVQIDFDTGPLKHKVLVGPRLHEIRAQPRGRLLLSRFHRSRLAGQVGPAALDVYDPVSTVRRSRPVSPVGTGRKATRWACTCRIR